MSPEQTRGELATTATDVWALGLIAFYMLTGRLFWRSCMKPDSELGVMKEIAEEAIPIASMRALELGAINRIPPGFNEWFAQCMARNPNERFVNATAAYAALAHTLRP
jgi:serine/threonine protein kinase